MAYRPVGVDDDWNLPPEARTALAGSTELSAAFAAIESPVFTGSPRVPTQSAADDSTRAASTSWVRALVDQKSQLANVLLFGAKGDTRVVGDGAMTSGQASLSSGSAAFTASDIGKTVMVQGAGAGGACLIATITAISSGTSAALSATASVTVSGVLASVGTDDTTAFRSAIGGAAGRTVVVPGGRRYTIAGTIDTADGGEGLTVLGVRSPTLVLPFGALQSTVTFAVNSPRQTFQGLDFLGGGTVFKADTTGGKSGTHATIERCTGQGMYIFALAWYASQMRVIRNVVTGLRAFGAEFWGGEGDPSKSGYVGDSVFNIDGGLVEGNTFIGADFSTLTAGAITCPAWACSSRHIVMTGNYFSTFTDVGADFEHSDGCIASSNTIIDCANGGLSAFFGCSNCTWVGNTVVVTAAVNPVAGMMHGAVNIHSSTLAHKGLSFIGNTLRVSSDAAYAVRSYYSQINSPIDGFVFAQNHLIVDSASGADVNINNVINGTMSGNRLSRTGVVLSRVRDFRFSGNTLTGKPSASSAALRVNGVDSTHGSQRVVIDGNCVILPSSATAGAAIAIENTAGNGGPSYTCMIANNVSTRGVAISQTDSTTLQQNNLVTGFLEA